MFERDAARPWTLVQQLVLDLVLKGSVDVDMWITASRLIHIAFDVAKRRPDDAGPLGSAYDNLAYLAMLTAFLPGDSVHHQSFDVALVQVREHVQGLLGALGPRSFQAFSTVRQIGRIGKWMRSAKRFQEAGMSLESLAQEVHHKEGVPDRWLER
jgi:hypothetical protein